MHPRTDSKRTLRTLSNNFFSFSISNFFLPRTLLALRPVALFYWVGEGVRLLLTFHICHYLPDLPYKGDLQSRRHILFFSLFPLPYAFPYITIHASILFIWLEREFPTSRPVFPAVRVSTFFGKLSISLTCRTCSRPRWPTLIGALRIGFLWKK